jgi:hypothetical protein
MRRERGRHFVAQNAGRDLAQLEIVESDAVAFTEILQDRIRQQQQSE